MGVSYPSKRNMFQSTEFPLAITSQIFFLQVIVPNVLTCLSQILLNYSGYVVIMSIYYFDNGTLLSSIVIL